MVDLNATILPHVLEFILFYYYYFIQEIESKNSELKTLKEDLSKWKLESSGLKEQLEISKNKLTEEISKLEKIKAEAVSKLTEEIESLKAATAEKKSEIDSLKAQMSESNKKFEEKIEKFKNDMSDKENQLNKANQVKVQDPILYKKYVCKFTAVG